MPATLYNLDRYGLEITGLKALGDRPGRDLRLPPRNPFRTAVPASTRGAEPASEEPPEDRLERVRAQWRGGPLRLRDEDLPWSFDAVVPARELPRIVRFRELDSVFVKKIQGLRKRPERKQPQWYAVRARIVIQVEDQTRGMESVEDRIVLVQARSFEDAERRLQPEWEQYAEPYLNPNGEMVRWQLEEVVDVYEIGTLDLDPRGIKVYSRLFDEHLAKRAWEARLELDDTKSNTALAAICGELRTRVHYLPDARSRQLISDALEWAEQYPERIRYHTKTKNIASQLYPIL